MVVAMAMCVAMVVILVMPLAVMVMVMGILLAVLAAPMVVGVVMWRRAWRCGPIWSLCWHAAAVIMAQVTRGVTRCHPVTQVLVILTQGRGSRSVEAMTRRVCGIGIWGLAVPAMVAEHLQEVGTAMHVSRPCLDGHVE